MLWTANSSVMNKISSIAILALSVAFAISPAFAPPFSGFTESQLPNPQIDPPVQPAGYAFAIWGVIYIWLIVSALFGIWKRIDADDWHHARLPLGFSLAIGVPWIAIANSSAIWATVTIILMAIGAILALIRAPQRDRWWFQAPVALYAGWLTAASWVSIATTMAGYNMLFGAQIWAIIGITGALCVAYITLNKRANAPEYFVSIVWALIGIIVANGAQNLPISALAFGGALVLIASAVKLRS